MKYPVLPLPWGRVEKPVDKVQVCAVCGQAVPQVASATPELAMWQHMNWIHNEGGK